MANCFLFFERIEEIENTTRVPVVDDLSYNEWFLKRSLTSQSDAPQKPAK